MQFSGNRFDHLPSRAHREINRSGARRLTHDIQMADAGLIGIINRWHFLGALWRHIWQTNKRRARSPPAPSTRAKRRLAAVVPVRIAYRLGSMPNAARRQSTRKAVPGWAENSARDWENPASVLRHKHGTNDTGCTRPPFGFGRPRG